MTTARDVEGGGQRSGVQARSTLGACPRCGSSDVRKFQFEFDESPWKDVEDVVICDHCGCVQTTAVLLRKAS